eukprot:4045203-Amphidinium_carterae.1
MVRRSRIALGPSGGSYVEYKFRAKPGAKYRYRVATDYDPEWGTWPPEATTEKQKTTTNTIKTNRKTQSSKSIGIHQILENEQNGVYQ